MPKSRRDTKCEAPHLAGLKEFRDHNFLQLGKKIAKFFQMLNRKTFLILFLLCIHSLLLPWGVGGGQ